MNFIQQAKQEWEANTTPYPKKHIVRPVVKNIPLIIPELFGQFDKAIALLNWNEDCIEIRKLETLQPRQGGASRLIRYLKCLSDKYQIPLWGHARLYEPDEPFPNGPLLTKTELCIFYIKHGFQLREIDDDASEIKYIPNLPSHTN